MTNGEFLEKATNHAKDYRLVSNESINRNTHMNDITVINLPQEVIDAVLVDFINFMGAKYGVDYGLYTKDIQK